MLPKVTEILNGISSEQAIRATSQITKILFGSDLTFTDHICDLDNPCRLLCSKGGGTVKIVCVENDVSKVLTWTLEAGVPETRFLIKRIYDDGTASMASQNFILGFW